MKLRELFRNANMKPIHIANVTAYDEGGNKYGKEVTLERKNWEYIIGFDRYARYYLHDLLVAYPYHYDLVIDLFGQNHLGTKVWVEREQVNKVIELAMSKLKELQQTRG